MKRCKRFFCMVLIIFVLFNTITVSYSVRKVDAAAVAVGTLAWDVVGTIIAVLAGYEISEIVTDDESKYCKPSAWVADNELTQEKINFVLEHEPVGHYRMTDEKSQELWRNINKEEFDELRNLYNSNRNPDFYTGDGNNLAINLNLFKDIFKYFRDKVKLRNNVYSDNEIVFQGSGYFNSMHGWQDYEMYSPDPQYTTDMRYAIVMFTDYSGLWVQGKYYSTYFEKVDLLPRKYTSIGPSNMLVTNISIIKGPVFNSNEDADEYLISGKIDNAINKEFYQQIDTIPENFKPDTKTVLPNEINELDELKEWITGLITPAMPSTRIIKIIGGEEIPASGIYDLDEDEDKDYSGFFGSIINFLKDILDAILFIPTKIGELFDFLKDVLKKILDGILSIPGHIDDFFNWLKDAWGDIKLLPQRIIDGLKSLIESLFVPDEIAVDEFVNHINQKINNQAGLLTFPLSLVILFLNNVLSLGVSDCILTIPEMSVMGHKIMNEYNFNFSQFMRKSEFSDVYSTYILVTNFIMILGVIFLAIKKGDQIIRGN